MINFFKEMNWITIVGIIFLAIGTAMTIYGPLKNSNKETKSIKEEIAKFSEELEKARSDPDASPEKLNKIESEFDDWAKQFVNNKEKMELDIKANDIDVEKRKIRLSQKWYPTYNQLFLNIEGLIKAYNKQSGDSIKYSYSKLPSNLFSQEANEWKYVISFSSDRHWVIHIWPSMPIEEDCIPPILLSVVKNKNEKIPFKIVHEVEFGFLLKSNDVFIHARNIDIVIPNLQGNYNLKNYPDILFNSFKRLFEYELIRKKS